MIYIIKFKCLQFVFLKLQIISESFNFTYFGPKGGIDESVPLIVAPHGGPHSNFTNSFSFDYSLFALIGK